MNKNTLTKDNESCVPSNSIVSKSSSIFPLLTGVSIIEDFDILLKTSSSRLALLNPSRRIVLSSC